MICTCGRRWREGPAATRDIGEYEHAERGSEITERANRAKAGILYLSIYIYTIYTYIYIYIYI